MGIDWEGFPGMYAGDDIVGDLFALLALGL